jgi:hypothetical protein
MAWMMAIFMVTSVGCGPKRDVAEVTGVVLMDGKPMDLINIEFWSKNGPRSYGKTDAEGKFHWVTGPENAVCISSKARIFFGPGFRMRARMGFAVRSFMGAMV